MSGVTVAQFAENSSATIGKEIGMLTSAAMVLLGVILWFNFRSVRETAYVLVLTVLAALSQMEREQVGEPGGGEVGIEAQPMVFGGLPETPHVGTDRLAEVAAEDPVAHQRLDRRVDHPPVFDGEVADATSCIDHV